MKLKNRTRKSNLDDESKRKFGCSVSLAGYMWDAIDSVTNNRSEYIQILLEADPAIKKAIKELK